MEFSFAQVEHTLALTHQIRHESRSAFAHRLKHLQRLGFPAGINTGRGRAATYSVGHLFQWALALELFQFGLTPERAVNVLQQNMDTVLKATFIAVSWRESGLDEGPMCLWFDPTVLLPMMEQEEEDQASNSFFFGGWAIVKETFGGLWDTQRIALINLSKLLLNVTTEMVSELKLGSETEILIRLRHWVIRAEDELYGNSKA